MTGFLATDRLPDALTRLGQTLDVFVPLQGDRDEAPRLAPYPGEGALVLAPAIEVHRAETVVLDLVYQFLDCRFAVSANPSVSP